MSQIADVSDFINQQVKWRLQKELQEFHEQIKGILKVRDLYKNQIEDLEDRIKQQSDSIIFLTKTIHYLEKKVNDSETTNGGLKDLLIKSKEELLKLNTEVAVYEKDSKEQNVMLNVLYENSIQETLEQTFKMKKIQRHLDTLIDENEIYKSDCTEIKLKLRSIEIDNKHLKSLVLNLEEISRDNDELREKYDAVCDEKKKKVECIKCTSNDELVRNNSDIHLKLEESEYKVKVLEMKLSVIEKEMVTQNSFCENHITEIKLKNEKLNENVEKQNEIKAQNLKLRRWKCDAKEKLLKMEKRILKLQKKNLQINKETTKIGPDSLKTKYTIPKKPKEKEDLTEEEKIGKEKLNESFDKNSKNPRNLFVRNIQYFVKKASIEKLFQPFGEKNGFSVKFPMKENKEENKGYCWIKFQSTEDAEMAIEKINNLDFCGRKLEVRWN